MLSPSLVREGMRQIGILVIASSVIALALEGKQVASVTLVVGLIVWLLGCHKTEVYNA